jgi:hypothetical protein
MIVVRIIAWAVSLSCLAGVCWWTRLRSRMLAAILAAGIIGRAAIGVALFAISRFDLPVLRGLHTGGGFWTLAIDADWYFHTAATAARIGVGTITDSLASPLFLRVFAVWLQLTGISPANAILFNLLCYVGIAAIIVAACQERTVAAVALAAVTIDPAFVMFGTQALKDPFCIFLIAVAASGVRIWSDGIDSSRFRGRRAAIGLMAISVGVFGIAGIRAYIAVFVMIGVFGAALMALLVSERTDVWKTAAAYVVLLVVLTGSFARGAGGYYPYYKGLVLSALLTHSLAATVRDLDYARSAFAASGGATSFAEPLGPTGTGILDDAVRQSGATNSRLRRVARGCAAVFVPISVLRALSIVTFNGGRGLLFITDIDTLVVDLTLAAAVYFLVASAPPRRALPIVACLVVILVLTTGVLAYVVTNFGTLFRLRLLALVPLWLLPPFVYTDRTLHNAPAAQV